MEDATGDRLGQCLGRHRIVLAVVDDTKPRAEQQRNQPLRRDWQWSNDADKTIIDAYHIPVIVQTLHNHSYLKRTVSVSAVIQSNSSVHYYDCVALCKGYQYPERPILCQISSLIYPKIQKGQVIMNVLNPSCAQPLLWSTSVLWKRFEDGLARNLLEFLSNWDSHRVLLWHLSSSLGKTITEYRQLNYTGMQKAPPDCTNMVILPTYA